jgi:cytochrome P450
VTTTVDPDLADVDFAIVPASPVHIPDYHERLARVRADRAVARANFGGEVAVFLVRYHDVVAALKDEQTWSKAEAFRPLTFPIMGPNMQGYDDDRHTRNRALVSPAFRRSFVSSYVDPILRPSAERLIDRFADRGEADLVHDFTSRYPLTITAQLLGLPEDDEHQLKQWAQALIGFPVTDYTWQAKAEFADYALPLMEERRARPGDDMISRLVHEELDGERLTDEEILGFLRLLFPAGVDTTWLALGSLVIAVLSHPDADQRVRRDAEARAWAVEETLRWESVIGAEPRLTLRDVTIDGDTIPEGTLVRLCLPSANRDEREFPDPDTWDLDRRPRHHVAFGLGRHFCLGAFLARAELATGVQVLLERLPGLRLDGEPAIRGAVLRGPASLCVGWDKP